MAKLERDKIYECAVQRRRLATGGGYEFFWKTKSIEDTIVDADQKFRCKDCDGEVKIFRRHVANGAAPHAEHKHKTDAEYCPSGAYFRQATDGREPRRSTNPVL